MQAANNCPRPSKHGANISQDSKSLFLYGLQRHRSFDVHSLQRWRCIASCVRKKKHNLADLMLTAVKGMVRCAMLGALHSSLHNPTRILLGNIWREPCLPSYSINEQYIPWPLVVCWLAAYIHSSVLNTHHSYIWKEDTSHGLPRKSDSSFRWLFTRSAASMKTRNTSIPRIHYWWEIWRTQDSFDGRMTLTLNDIYNERRDKSMYWNKSLTPDGFRGAGGWRVPKARRARYANLFVPQAVTLYNRGSEKNKRSYWNCLTCLVLLMQFLPHFVCCDVML